jgi:hypothetical protein
MDRDMTVVLATTRANAALDNILANANNGRLQLRAGTDNGPDAAASGTLVSEHTMSATAFAAAASKVATANAVGSAVAASGGTPSHARLTQSDGTTGVLHLSCGGSFSYTNSGNVLTTNAAHGWAASTPVRVFAEPGGALTTGLSQDTTYYVRAPSGSTLELSLTPGGAAVVLTGTGTAVQRICLASTDVAIGSNSGDILAGTTVQIANVRLRFP